MIFVFGLSILLNFVLVCLCLMLRGPKKPAPVLTPENVGDAYAVETVILFKSATDWRFAEKHSGKRLEFTGHTGTHRELAFNPNTGLSNVMLLLQDVPTQICRLGSANPPMTPEQVRDYISVGK